MSKVRYNFQLCSFQCSLKVDMQDVELMKILEERISQTYIAICQEHGGTLKPENALILMLLRKYEEEQHGALKENLNFLDISFAELQKTIDDFEREVI